MIARVETPWYDVEGRKYINLEIDGQTVRAKVPWRYGRVMCKVKGIRPIQELKQGEFVEVFLEKKLWNNAVYWVIVSLSTEPII
jgi:hypothetical protein